MNFQLRRGETFAVQGPGALPPGTWTVAAQLRSLCFPDRVIDLDASLAVVDGQTDIFTLSLAADATQTSGLSPGDYQFDVRFSSGGLVHFTDVYGLNVTAPITR